MAKNDEQSFPDAASSVVLLVDVVNDLEFEGGEALLEFALPMADRLAALKARAQAAGVPVVYLNDNFGQWRSDFRSVVARTRKPGMRGRAVVERLLPAEQDYFVLKPKHSGFFGTTLETLLRFLGAQRLIVTGLTTDMCVLFTVMDAYMRDYQLCVPCDGCAASDSNAHERAIAYMATRLKADVGTVAQLSF